MNPFMAFSEVPLVKNHAENNLTNLDILVDV
jgi:hypothetical protein